jgi:hypothetical protein
MATFRASTAVDMSTPFYFYDAYGASIISTGPNLIVLRDPFGNRQDYLGPPEKVCGGQTDNELIPNQTETYGSSWGDLNI